MPAKIRYALADNTGPHIFGLGCTCLRMSQIFVSSHFELFVDGGDQLNSTNLRTARKSKRNSPNRHSSPGKLSMNLDQSAMLPSFFSPKDSTLKHLPGLFHRTPSGESCAGDGTNLITAQHSLSLRCSRIIAGRTEPSGPYDMPLMRREPPSCWCPRTARAGAPDRCPVTPAAVRGIQSATV